MIAAAAITALIAGAVLTVGASTTATENTDLQAGNSVLTQQRDATADQALRAADPVLDLCDDDTDVGRALRADPGDPCGLAEQVRTAPVAGPTGPGGPPGAEGRGIAGTSIVGGRFLVTYTDGTTQDLGSVVGAPGVDGAPGRGIVASTIEAGRLILTFSDGTRSDLGRVVGDNGADGEDGASGADGEDGQPGRGVAAVALNEGRLLVTYTDGAVDDLGPVPAGPVGPQGVGVQSVRAEVVDGECVLVFVLVDPATGSASEQSVPVAAQVCAAGPIIEPAPEPESEPEAVVPDGG